MKTLRKLYPLLVATVMVVSAVPFFYWPIRDSIEYGTLSPGVVLGVLFYLPVLGGELCAGLALRYLLRPAEERRRVRSVLALTVCGLCLLCVGSLAAFFLSDNDLLLGLSLVLVPVMAGVWGIAALVKG